jgi:hypothetical protein
MHSIRLWWAASRPFSFTASVIPVMVGTLLASEISYSWWKALLALFGAVAIHAGTNLVNDYYDHVKGADNPESLGPAGFIQQGTVTPRSVLVAGIVCFAAGAATGLVLCATRLAAHLAGHGERAGGFLHRRAGTWPIGLRTDRLHFMGPVIVVGGTVAESWTGNRWWRAAHRLPGHGHPPGEQYPRYRK